MKPVGWSQMRFRLKLAFTLIELLSCIVLMAVLSSLIYPVLGQAKMSAKTAVAKTSLRNLYIATTIYRSDYEGIEFGDPASMGLPSSDSQGRNPALMDILTKTVGSNQDSHSPCGRHPQPINYTSLAYMPNVVDDWRQWVKKLENMTILFADPNCNSRDIDINDQYAMKRSLGVALDGHIISVSNDQSHYWLQDFYIRGIQ